MYEEKNGDLGGLYGASHHKEEQPFVGLAHEQNSANGNNFGVVSGVANPISHETKDISHKDESEAEKSNKIVKEVDEALRTIAAISPDAAKNLPRVSNSMTHAELKMIETEVAKVRDEVVAKDNMEKAQQMVGGLLGVAGIAALGGEVAKNPSVLSAAFVGDERIKDRELKQNPEFEKLLARMDNKDFSIVSGGQNTSRENLSNLKVPMYLPDLVAQEQALNKNNNKTMAL